MNGKTASFLTKVATKFEQPKRMIKKMWNDTPRNKRSSLRLRLAKEMAVMD